MADEENIAQLQAEQRDIEAKLKFIDSLINNQQTAAPKYHGGGILRKPAQQDFIANLEQYQRAIKELKVTMENLGT